MTVEYRPLTIRDKIAFFAMIIGMFMAVLDIQIVASSISVIGSGLSATHDELSWIQTAYLIAEVMVIPVTGFLARLFSTRISYFMAAMGFTVMSVMCSLAWNIESMIIFRAIQGFFGGAMIPTVFATTFIIFPYAQRATVSIIIGLTVTVAPTLGPTIGGYITEILSWHFMFLVNVIPGIFVCTTVFLYAHFDEPHPDLLKNFDYFGIALLVVSLGSLQYILEEGSREGWLESNSIIFLSCIAVSSFIWLVVHELTTSKPILDLYAYTNKNFSLGCALSFVLGTGLYGAVYILPLFLFRVAGMDAYEIGIVMMVTGSFQFLAAPVAGKLFAGGVDRRVILGIGLTMFSFGCYLNSELTADSNFGELFLPQACRGFSLMFCFVPINDIALGSLAPNQVQNASGLYNLTRNLGGAIGLAVINTALIDKTKIFSQHLHDNITITSPNAHHIMYYFKTILFYGKSFNPQVAGYSMINSMVQKQAFIIAINDIFMSIALIFLSGLLLLPFIEGARGGGSVTGAGH